ncbi:MAG: trimethylamine corrinoid protein 2, partial [Candidatus Nanoarchaeia archaeon]|nr:trimethylamine corrinoid protein 2 [Candidatus Nanoarchaeia archaeon]
FLDHCVFHLDGPGALRHLDDILAIKDIDVLQWVPGAGQPPVYEWLDVLKKAQKAGKGLQIYGVNLDIIKRISRELSPEGIVYCLDAKSRKEVEETTDWLEKNT